MPSGTESETTPPVVDGDRIVPMHLFDDTAVNNNVINSVTLCFDTVMDADRIHSALTRLLQIGEWKKFGGRLRRNKTGKLEVHILDSFTEAHPAVRYYHEKFDSNIHDHPIASQLPRAGRSAKTTDSIWDSFRSLIVCPGGPQKLDDYLSRDEPRMSLRINSFRDATLVCWYSLHNVTDGSSTGIIFQSWSDVMAGKQAQVPEKIGAFEDTFARFASTAPKEELQFVNKFVGSEIPDASIVLGNAWDALERATSQSKTIFLPKRVMNRINQNAIADLTTHGFPPELAHKSDPSKPFLSEGDVILSWLSRHALAELAPATPHPVTIINSYDTRSRVPSAFGVHDSTGYPIYIGNATLRGHIFVSSSLVTEAPLGEFAGAIRTQLAKQTTPEQVHARIAVDYKMLQADEGARASFIEAGSTRIFFTNQSKAYLYSKVDFSAAVMQPNVGKKAGLVSHIHTQAISAMALPLNVFSITGIDREGNYWMVGGMTEQGWDSLERDLAVLNNFSKL